MTQNTTHPQPHLRTPWVSTLERHDQALRQQRAQAAERRSRALAEGERALGSREAVAGAVGTTPRALEAVADHTGAPTPDPLPELLDLALPTAGGQAWTRAEWERLEEGEQRTRAALLTAQVWTARAHTLSHLARDAYRALVAIGEAVREDWGTTAELRQVLSRAGAGSWAPMLSGEGDVSAHLRVLADLSQGMRDQADHAWHQADLWRQAAEGDQD